MTLDEALALLEALQRKAAKSLGRQAMISAADIERLRRLLTDLRA